MEMESCRTKRLQNNELKISAPLSLKSATRDPISESKVF